MGELGLFGSTLPSESAARRELRERRLIAASSSASLRAHRSTMIGMSSSVMTPIHDAARCAQE